jgi:prepilin-type processing-associated H-X9-DG protein
LEALPNGRYRLASDERDVRLPLLVVLGDEASDVPPGVVLVGREARLTSAYIARLGRPNQRTKALRKLLDDVDTAAPFWVAALPGKFEFSELSVEAMPRITGHLYVSGAKAGGITLTFADAGSAKQFVEGIDRIPAPLRDYIRPALAVEGNAVAFRFAQGANLFDWTLLAMREGRRAARRSISESNLRCITTAALSHAAEHSGRLPESFEPLIEGGGITASTLDSPCSKAPGPDYALVGLANVVDIPDPSAAITLYERPENFDGTGTHVVFADGHVAWVDAARFRELLDRSRTLARQQRNQVPRARR